MPTENNAAEEYFHDLHALLAKASPKGGFALGLIEGVRLEFWILLPRAVMEAALRAAKCPWDAIEMIHGFRMLHKDVIANGPFRAEEIQSAVREAVGQKQELGVPPQPIAGKEKLPWPV